MDNSALVTKQKSKFSMPFFLQPYQRSLLIGAFSLLAVFYLLSTQFSNPIILPEKSVEVPIVPIASVAPTELVEAPQQPATLTPQRLAIRPGDSLATIFQRVHLPYSLALKILENSQAEKILSQIKPNHTITFFWDKEDQLHRITYEINSLSNLVLTAFDQPTFQVSIDKTLVQTFPVFREGVVTRSLTDTFRNMNLSVKQQQTLVNLFADQINFSRDIRKGDVIKVLFQEKTASGELLGPGAFLAAILKLNNELYSAIRFKLPDGRFDYFTLRGDSLKRAFNRFPVHFSRISSSFTTRRYHPMLHRFRAHEGVDLAAPYGTPIHAAADGKVILRGRKGGYGQTVILKHGRHISTLYAHMSRFARGVFPGKAIKRGDVIGYVGSSGLATGPHVHYEFRIDGHHYDPVHIDLPHAEAVPKSLLAQFKTRADQYLTEMANFEKA